MTLFLLADWNSASNVAQGAISYILLIGMQACPIFFSLILYTNFEVLDRYLCQKKIGTMYNGAYLSGNKIYPVSYSVVFLIRRSTFILLTFMLFDQPAIQIQVFVFMSIMYIIYLNSERIYDLRVDLYLENLNEAFFLMALYHFLLFALVSDPAGLEKLGKSMITVVVMILGIGAIVIVGVNVKVLHRKLKMYLWRKAWKAKIDQRKIDLTQV